VVGVVVLGGCGSQPTNEAGRAEPAAGYAAASGAADGSAGGARLASLPGRDSVMLDKAVHGVKGAPSQGPVVAKRALVRTGEVRLTSDDVAGAAAGVRKVARTYAGSIADEQATAAHGRLRQEHLTLRVPTGRFAAAMAAIRRLGGLVSATSSTDDVTTQVIDVRVHVRAQRASLRRMEDLMRRARTLGQVIAIETQLTRRQEALDALEQKQAYLEDQTSMSTITVVVSRAPHSGAGRHHEAGGFVGGLRHGWHALQAVGNAIAAGVGAALPFGVPLLVVGAPAWWLLRRRRQGVRNSATSA
jgi:hypothetical protein